MARVQMALLAVVVSLVAACGGSPAVKYGSEQNPAADFSTLRQYAFAERSERPPTGFQRVHVGTEIMERRIERALTRDLSAKGFEEVQREEADFIVFYGLGARDVVDPGAPQEGSGWSSSMANVHGQAAVIIDFVKAADGEHLWHGYAEGAVRDGEAIDYEAAITAVVDRIVARFDPPPAAAPTAGGEEEAGQTTDAEEGAEGDAAEGDAAEGDAAEGDAAEGDAEAETETP